MRSAVISLACSVVAAIVLAVAAPANSSTVCDVGPRLGQEVKHTAHGVHVEIDFTANEDSETAAADIREKVEEASPADELVGKAGAKADQHLAKPAAKRLCSTRMTARTAAR